MAAEWGEVKEQHAHHRADGGLQNLEGELQPCVFRCAVNEGTPQRVAHHHDDCPRKNRQNGTRHRGQFFLAPGNERDDHGLQAVRDQRNEHRRGVKEEVAEKRADSAHKEGRDRVKDEGGQADDDIVEIKVPARHRHAKGTERDVQRHKERGIAELAGGINAVLHFFVLRGLQSDVSYYILKVVL